MSSFTVETPALAAAALTINAHATGLTEAHAAATQAAAQAGAFGGEPITAAYESACQSLAQAITELESTMQGLARNVAAAAVGYLVTDQGVVPTSALPGFRA